MILALIAILFVAAVLRCYSVGFGLPALNDPDELTFELGAVRLLSKHTLNPGWFGHPATTTIYLLAILDAGVFGLGWLVGWFGSPQAFADAIYADPSWVILPGRVAMVMFALATIVLTWRLAHNLCGPWVALAAAALLAMNPVHITWSQIIRSDMMACFFLLLCMLAALRIQRGNRWRDYVMAALWTGAAMATKWPYGVCALAVLGAGLMRMADHPEERGLTLRRLALFGPMALGFLFLISPYLLLDHETALRNMRGEAQAYHLGATGGMPWENAWWYLSGPVVKGLGAMGAFLALIGGARLMRNREAVAIIGFVALAFLVVVSTQRIVWERWALALTPLLAIIAAAGLGALIACASERWRKPAFAAVLIAALLPLGWTAQADTRMRLNDTRQQASRWALANIRPGSRVLVEHFAFDLLRQPWHFLFPLGDAGCVDARAALGGKVQLSAVDSRRGSRTNVDFGTVAENKRGTCRVDYAILTQADRYAAERNTFRAEDAAYRSFIAQGRTLAIFAPRAGETGGPVVRIVAFNTPR